LKKSEETFRTLLESAAEGIVIIDRDGRIVLANDKAEKLFGYCRQEMIGQVVEMLLPEARREVHREHRKRYLADPRNRPMGIGLDLVARHRDNHVFPVEISLSHAGEGDNLLIMASVVDITRRKQSENEIKRLNTELAAQAADLESANRELEAFNYTVAHDLRNPLSVISTYCQALKELCSDKLDEICSHYLQETYDGTLRMNRLIETLLNFSRLAHIEPHRETVDFSAMAHEVAAELMQTEPGRRVTFLIADGVNADGDAALLRVVLTNLLGNACKYTASREQGVIEFGITEVEGKPACFVRDNGAGFNMADVNRLFVPFQRLPGAEERRGFGIGLATVERIIRRHGGRVWAVGESGKGATFYFTL